MIPDGAIPLLEGLPGENHTIDLRNPEDRTEFIRGVSTLFKRLKDSSPILIVIRGIEALKVSNDLSITELYELIRLLRNLEEETVRQNHVIISTVSGGEIVPHFPFAEISPFGLMARKVGFLKQDAFRPSFDQRGTGAPMNSLVTRPRDAIEDIEGSKRRAYYQKYIDLVFGGEHVIFYGLRRGGKTSFKHILERQAEAKGYKTATLGSLETIPFTVASTLFPSGSAEFTLLKDTALENLAPTLLTLRKEDKLPKQPLLLCGDEIIEQTCLLYDHAETQEKRATIGRCISAFVALMKDLKENRLPITIACVAVSSMEPVFRGILNEYPQNSREDWRSAFSTGEVGLLSVSESAELVRDLIARAGIQFPSELDQQTFISRVKQGGQPWLINLHMRRITTGEDPELTWTPESEGTTNVFELYFKNMMPWQRLLIQYLCLSKNHRYEFSTTDPKAFYALDVLKRRGYITYSIGEDNKIQVELTTKEFLPIVRRLLQEVIACTGETLSQEIFKLKATAFPEEIRDMSRARNIPTKTLKQFTKDPASWNEEDSAHWEYNPFERNIARAKRAEELLGLFTGIEEAVIHHLTELADQGKLDVNLALANYDAKTMPSFG